MSFFTNSALPKKGLNAYIDWKKLAEIDGNSNTCGHSDDWYTETGIS